MPVAEVVAVVAARGIPRRGAEVAEVARGTRRLVVVVPGDRERARLVPAPARVVALGVVRVRADGEGVVPERRDGAGRHQVEQGSSGFVAGAVAARDVTGGEQHHRGGCGDDVGLR